MVSFLLWPLAVLGAIFWVALPAGVLIMAIFYRGTGFDPSAVQPCRGYDSAEPAAEPCWVPAGQEYCPRHAPSPGTASSS
ncbi:MAG: hypothetical protein ACRD0O_21500 [Acidimicrobiia bacterium]